MVSVFPLRNDRLSSLSLWLFSAFAALLLTIGGCKPKAELFVQDENSVAWMTLNNTFAGGDPDYFSEEETENTSRPYWSGVLFQIGVYEPDEGIEPQSIVKYVQLYSGEDMVQEYTPSQFTWINLVSEKNDWKQPLDPVHALLLYPNASADQCFCAFPAKCNADLFEDGCLRNRLLHGFLRDVTDATLQKPARHILTYWQGVNGYTVKVKQDHGPEPFVISSYDFELHNRISVDVYIEKVKGSPPYPYLDDVDHFETGKIDRVAIITPAPGTNHGLKHDPAWPVDPPGN